MPSFRVPKDDEEDQRQPPVVAPIDNKPNEEAEKAAAAFAFAAMLEKQKERVAEHLSLVYQCDPWFAEGLYERMATDERIEEFLRACPLYDYTQYNREWTGIKPRGPHGWDPKPETVEMMATIIACVMEALGDHCGRRYVMKTQDVKLFHEEKYTAEVNYSSPSLVIVGEGPSFERPQEGFRGIGFSNVTTCIDVITNPRRHFIEDKEFLERHAIYARQIFIQQPNRRFVRTFVIGNYSIQFFHFDRSGIHRGHIGDLHKNNVKTFVRLILGLSSLDEEDLGLDSSIQWQLNDEDRKVRGILTTTDDETKITKTYQLTDLKPLFYSNCGFSTRGTTCWALWDNEHERQLLAKDSWREEGTNIPEFKNLKKARGLEGVAQMISYEANHGETKDSGVTEYIPREERPNYPSDWSCPVNQICSRIVMERYGWEVDHFESEKQLLCAVRDAIAGHRNLYLKAKTLHRDFAYQNIVFGKPGAPPGQQGILIDLDLARPISHIKGVVDAVGHTLFYSIGIIINATSKQTGASLLPHDYLDDLQSSFYVLALLMYLCDGPVRYQEPRPQILRDWFSAMEETIPGMLKHLEFKKGFILSGKPVDPTQGVAPYWSKASRKLLRGFYAFTREMAKAKELIRRWRDDGQYEELLTESTVRRNYDRVLQMFDVAIVQLDQERKKAAAVGPSIQGRKRKVEDDDDRAENKEALVAATRPRPKYY
ncbi:hypothetical protein EST38_g9326 [Candolleomyces aberdarensis]|uniref:Fungal-type protein kinase domain-containing protein n=1 Tax=Candolleomyces aberdarensis TaxID=2316362 RepID=A0A4Q2DB14_9AGAR|nr:hypothetical protein EST38_g9326 [Candolleomyces aberdarensis]